jgi:hypothetical protein
MMLYVLLDVCADVRYVNEFVFRTHEKAQFPKVQMRGIVACVAAVCSQLLLLFVVEANIQVQAIHQQRAYVTSIGT